MTADAETVLMEDRLPEDQIGEEDWRGVASEEVDDVSAEAGIHLAARSRRLLSTLLAPHKRLMLLVGLLIVVEQASFLAGPLIISIAIDSAVPALIAGDGSVLTWCVIGYLAAGLLNALSRASFVRVSARISQAVLLDLRGRVFSHAQALSISFHERYTSGRVISRLTSDLDTLSDLAEQGLDGLISGVLSVVVISVVLLVLDLPLGLIAMAAFIPIFFLTRWFQRRSRRIYRRTRKAIASLIVQFMETMNGLRAVLAFRREARNEAIFSEFNTENARANGDGLVAIAQYSPFVRLVGNICLTVVMVVGAVRVINGEMAIGVLAAFLLYVRRMYDPLDELAMFYNSYQSASAALEKISGLLEEVPAVPEPSSPAPSPAGGFSGAVQMSGVEFGYSTEHVGAAALRPDDPGRPDGGRGRRHRCREVDAGKVAGPLLRPDVGRGARWTVSMSRRCRRTTCGAAW